MAATVKDTSYYTLIGANANGSMTWAHTVTSGSNRLLLVWLAGENATDGNAGTWSGVTYNGAALTKAKSHYTVEGVATVSAELWYLVNPPVGTADIVATANAGDVTPAVHAQGHAIGLTGAAQAAPEATLDAGSSADSTSGSLPITTLTANALIIDFMASNREEIPAPGVNQTLLTTALNTDASAQGQASATSSRVTTAAGAYTQSWTFSVAFGRIAYLAASIAAAAGGGDTVTISDFAAGRVFQRDSKTTGSVPVTAAYDGTAPTTAEARIMKGATVIKDWTALDIAGTDITGTLTDVPVGDGYKLEVRTLDATATPMVTESGGNSWGIGKLFLVCGSSTPAKWFIDATAEVADALVRKYGGAWAACTGAAAIGCGNAMVAAEPGVPVGLLSYGEASTTLTQWLAGDSQYAPAVAAVTALGGKLEGVIIHVGSNDARDGDIISQADHEADYRALIANLRADCGKAAFLASLPVMMIGSQSSPADSSALDQQWTWCRAAELDVADDAGNYMAFEPVTYPIDADNIHLTAAAMITEGRYVARCHASVVLGTGADRRGPAPISATYEAATGKIVITFERHGGTTLVGRIGQTDLTGFRVSTDDFATTEAIAAAIVRSASTVELTVATGLAGVKVDYLAGHNPDASGCVFNNASAPA